MRLTALVSLALPIMAFSQNSTVTTTSTVPSATPDYESICEDQASSYADVCPQCLYRCEGSSYVSECYYSTFFTINGIEANCEARGGYNCRQIAIDDVCPGTE
ncbi:hypothetical protein VPNG_08032 [Cytospora leucostoma]|uniref:Extracellular membrane protein CFEM domain-containing protein n=1 Tax=Cytospora leucostoma TaxID=1230097 RepID=A0A423WRM4_9PEZI|nr:hypothetical protein VPNG_08032 [Cytospora leucostoma]